MNNTGIVRRIDELGRIVIPKELRKTLRIKDGDNLEIFVDNDCIYLKKYSMIESLESIAKKYAESFNKILKHNIIITDMDKIIAVSGSLKTKYLNCDISNEVISKLDRRENFVSRQKKDLSIIDGEVENCYYTFSTIYNNGDVIGAVIIFSNISPIVEQEEKLGSILACLLGNYFV